MKPARGLSAPDRGCIQATPHPGRTSLHQHNKTKFKTNPYLQQYYYQHRRQHLSEDGDLEHYTQTWLHAGTRDTHQISGAFIILSIPIPGGQKFTPNIWDGQQSLQTGNGGVLPCPGNLHNMVGNTCFQYLVYHAPLVTYVYLGGNDYGGSGCDD